MHTACRFESIKIDLMNKCCDRLCDKDTIITRKQIASKISNYEIQTMYTLFINIFVSMKLVNYDIVTHDLKQNDVR